MSGHIRDRWIWLGLGLAFALSGLIAHLTTPSVDKKQDESIQADESDPLPAPTVLPLRTLRTLMDSPNLHIRQMAIDLALKRMHDVKLNIDVMRAIYADEKSADEDTRRKAKLTLDYLRSENEPHYTRSPSLSIASTSAANDDDIWLDGLEPVIPSLITPVAGWTAVPRERPAASDSDVRRRRREAVVLHEGSGEVNEDDIIRPSDMWQTIQPSAND